ncbi:flagellar biosynthesis protein FlhB [Chromobacterium sphagni]|uniref:Flagellar biosynthetic protein FlhB n=1 Tax=Chromobacterium sphagni TaxID=1903179 RepID=A0A1S1X3D3_9NEIS|nr:flagellar biosynthesis protein FlhB [Chromobacterium sphagni]OHX13989.1 flagellar biosynthesis protein FlhB [Chromobacterium sphagni]OHX20196.1 flagellar biosynthesis protein FlhB [Chromobacterium sphagni]
MAEDSDLERTEPASAKRLSMAREDGNIPRSRELSTFAVTMAGVSLLMVLGGKMASFLGDTMRHLLTFDQSTVQSTEPVLLRFKEAIFGALWQLAPFFAGLALVALFVPMLIGGWNLTLKAVGPNFGKLNPLPGIGRLFSLNSAAEGLKAILKSMLIGGIATWYIWRERGEIIGLLAMPLESGILKMTDMIIHTFFIVASAMILLVALDVPYQLWTYYKKLRMTKEEVKQEYKEAEGSPEVKGRIRQMQREAARKRMMQEVPKANVIVTNPTHFAVALKYDEGMRAPQVIAKGSLKLAEKIIDTGKDCRVPVMRSPSFARALYFNAELGEDIPAPLYAAAAQVLAYIFQLQQYQAVGGMAPVFPDKLEVPAELDPYSKRPQDSAPEESL